MRILNEADIINIMLGATLMASGGGGAFDDGMELVKTYWRNYPDKLMRCTLISPDEMEAGACTIGLAVMGSPVEGGKVDATNCILTAYEKAADLAVLTKKQLRYTLPLELGGFNTFTPILVSMIEGIPVVDADCAGRAVPGLETTVSNLNGLPTGPFAMGSIEGDSYLVQPKDPCDAAHCQNLAIPVVQMFRQNAGMAGWLFNREQVSACIPTGTVTKCLEIGRILRDHKTAAAGGVFDRIQEAGIAQTKTLVKAGSIQNYTSEDEVTGNNDIGYYEVASADGEKRFRIDYANESLVLKELRTDGERICMTAPDIITMYDTNTGKPLTNEDITLAHEKGELESLTVTLGVIKADGSWWKNEEKMQACWKKYFEEVHYSGALVHFEAV